MLCEKAIAAKSSTGHSVVAVNGCIEVITASSVNIGQAVDFEKLDLLLLNVNDVSILCMYVLYRIIYTLIWYSSDVLC